MSSLFRTPCVVACILLTVIDNAFGRCIGTPDSCDSDFYFGNQFECVRHGCSYLDYGVYGLGGCSGLPTSCIQLGEIGESCEWHGCHTVGLEGYGSQGIVENDHYSNGVSGNKSSEGLSNGAIVGIAFAATLIVVLFTIVIPFWIRRHEIVISKQTDTSNSKEQIKQNDRTNCSPGIVTTSNQPDPAKSVLSGERGEFRV